MPKYCCTFLVAWVVFFFAPALCASDFNTILRQDGSGLPGNWGTKDGWTVPADYAMDPEIVSAPEYRELAGKALEALPSLRLDLEKEDLFGPDRGIYIHPEETGDEWERRCRFTWVDEGKTNAQVLCGIRIQGGWNRRPEESPKHSFRVVFKKKYGPGKLRGRLFGEAGPKEFDSLILRSGCNNSWLHWNGAERKRGDLIRDQWMRETFAEMGQPSAMGRFVHLYLNGLYWGIYNVTERPDASFAASHLGGSRDNYDSFNADKLLDGSRDAWTELMRRVNRGVKFRDEFEAIAELLDLGNFVDFMILNLYGANADWDRHSNWYAARRNNPPGKFKFFVWDAERTLENATDSTIDFDDDQSPPRIFHRLIENEEFRKLFAQRARMHLSENGVLGPKRSAERYRKWAEQLDVAIIAESARWGDYRRDVHSYKEGPYELYTRDSHWRPEVKRLLEEYFPKRSGLFVEQLRKKRLY